MMKGTLTPAYGREYKSKAALEADWDADKDFLMSSPESSGYINKSQAREMFGETKIQARYKKNSEVTFVST